MRTVSFENWNEVWFFEIKPVWGSVSWWEKREVGLCVIPPLCGQEERVMGMRNRDERR